MLLGSVSPLVEETCLQVCKYNHASKRAPNEALSRFSLLETVIINSLRKYMSTSIHIQPGFTMYLGLFFFSFFSVSGGGGGFPSFFFLSKSLGFFHVVSFLAGLW